MSSFDALQTTLCSFLRPPDIPVGGRIFYRDSSFFFLSFSLFRRLISELAERNSTKIGHMLRHSSYCSVLFRNSHIFDFIALI